MTVFVIFYASFKILDQSQQTCQADGARWAEHDYCAACRGRLGEDDFILWLSCIEKAVDNHFFV